MSPTHAGFVLASALFFALHPAAALPATGGQEIQVDVRKNGSEIAVRVDCPVNAPLALVWAVLTDYDHMARFITNLEVSSVRERDGDTLQVFQKGRASRGLLTFSFENLREIRLIPYREIRSRLISGDLKASEFTTRVVDDGTQVHILNSGRFVPNVWVPPMIGPALIEAETRKQFDEIRAEILRRQER
ncbi:MAG TPA: SRPBCC family protein [Casimicrobiaceae bacterium]